MQETKTGRGVLVVLGWHVAIAAGLLIWIGSQHSMTDIGVSTQALLWLFMLLYGIPAWLISLTLGGVGVLLLKRRWGFRPILMGTVAALIGVLIVIAGTYALTALGRFH